MRCSLDLRRLAVGSMLEKAGAGIRTRGLEHFAFRTYEVLSESVHHV